METFWFHRDFLRSVRCIISEPQNKGSSLVFAQTKPHGASVGGPFAAGEEETIPGDTVKAATNDAEGERGECSGRLSQLFLRP